ncbi:MAG: ABC transporter ATP-binding protein [Clostridia bacterium]|nr:ABC transporter ATP-binding protein [Clostridia bacterium]
MIKVNNVVKYFDDFKALDGLTLHVEKGSIYGLVGPNGSGKTTIINHIVGVYKQDEGEVLVDGEKSFENVNIKEKIGYIQDDLFYYNQYTIKDMMKFYKGQYKNFDEDMFNKLKEVFKINPNRKIKTLSKGMKKQVAFWLVISSNPEVIILDEPLDGLDPITRRNVLKLLIGEVEKKHVTVLVSSHNLRELEDICDTVGFLDKGKLILEKKLDELTDTIQKVQVAYEDENKEIKLPSGLEIKDIQSVGKVKQIIIKGTKDEVEKAINDTKPLLVDFLPLSLEEIFIYEIGGEQIEINKFFE